MDPMLYEEMGRLISHHWVHMPEKNTFCLGTAQNKHRYVCGSKTLFSSTKALYLTFLHCQPV